MAAVQSNESVQFQEPISPTASNPTTTSAPTSTSTESAKPSITGILKKAVKAPSHEERVNEEPEIEDAIDSIGDDGQPKGSRST